MAMSTGVVEPQTKYFCHQCTSEINPCLPDFTCPLCQSGFVEEVAGSTMNLTHQQSDHDSDELRTRLGSSSRSRHRTDSDNDELSVPIHSFIDSILHILRDEPMSASEGLRSRRRRVRLSEMYERLTNEFGNLDDIITRLVNQLSVAGHEPSSAEQLQRLSAVSFRPQDLEDAQQCNVCLETYVVGDMVTQLPCSHVYHNSCIVQWLQQCGTCPVCRQPLPPVDDEHAKVELPGMVSAEDLSVEEDMNTNLPAVSDMVDVSDIAQTSADDVPVLSSASVIHDVELFDTETRF